MTASFASLVLNSKEKRRGLCVTARGGGIAYVTGTADLAEGERRQKLGMGAVSCRQGHHAQMAASHKVGCGASGSFFRGGERGIGLRPGS